MQVKTVFLIVHGSAVLSTGVIDNVGPLEYQQKSGTTNCDRLVVLHIVRPSLLSLTVFFCVMF